MKPVPDGTYDTAEILWEKPMAEDYAEYFFGPRNGNSLWVKFSESLGPNAWIGIFGCGERTTMKVKKVGEPDRFHVTSGGNCYLVTARQPSLTRDFDIAEFYPGASAVYDLDSDTLFVADLRIRAFRNGIELWRTDRASWDYIRDLEMVDGILSGVREPDPDGNERRFRFDLSTREFLSPP